MFQQGLGQQDVGQTQGNSAVGAQGADICLGQHGEAVTTRVRDGIVGGVSCTLKHGSTGQGRDLVTVKTLGCHLSPEHPYPPQQAHDAWHSLADP